LDTIFLKLLQYFQEISSSAESRSIKNRQLQILLCYFEYFIKNRKLQRDCDPK